MLATGCLCYLSTTTREEESHRSQGTQDSGSLIGENVSIHAGAPGDHRLVSDLMSTTLGLLPTRRLFPFFQLKVRTVETLFLPRLTRWVQVEYQVK